MQSPGILRYCNAYYWGHQLKNPNHFKLEKKFIFHHNSKFNGFLILVDWDVTLKPTESCIFLQFLHFCMQFFKIVLAIFKVLIWKFPRFQSLFTTFYILWLNCICSVNPPIFAYYWKIANLQFLKFLHAIFWILLAIFEVLICNFPQCQPNLLENLCCVSQ